MDMIGICGRPHIVCVDRELAGLMETLRHGGCLTIGKGRCGQRDALRQAVGQ
jgi:hypothetical protein